MAISLYALTSVALFRSYTGLTVPEVGDAVVETLINAATELIEGHCRRMFRSRQHTELHDLDGTGEVVLRQRPIVSVARVSIGRRGVLRISFVLANSSEATVSVDVGSTTLTLRSVVSAIVTTNAISLTAVATDTLQELATAITVFAGWTASVVGATYQPYPSADLWPASGVYCKDVQVTLDIPEAPATGFDILHDEGVLEHIGGFGISSSKARVVYTAGYALAALPEVLVQYCLILARKMYDLAQLDGNLQSERLGPWAWTLAKDNQLLDEGMQKGLIPWRNTLI